MIRLVALDIDGTLLAPGVHVDALPEEPITQAVHDLHEAGIVVVLATGRMFPGTACVAEHLGIDQPMICQQGASVHKADGSLRHGYAIEEEIAHELFDYARTHGWPLAWFDSQRYLVTEHCNAAQFFADVSRVEMEIHAEPHRSGVRATGIDIISDRQHAPDIHVLLEARYGGRITLLDFSTVTAVHAPDASKGNALHMLAQELGIAKDEVLAIGDSVNDVSMLSWAGHSAAPEHCDRYARESAGEILSGKGVDGVAARLRSVVDHTP
jgi:Cof subfamily protein (haloacid dehalogenase superfamily)